LEGNGCVRRSAESPPGIEHPSWDVVVGHPQGWRSRRARERATAAAPSPFRGRARDRGRATTSHFTTQHAEVEDTIAGWSLPQALPSAAIGRLVFGSGGHVPDGMVTRRVRNPVRLWSVERGVTRDHRGSSRTPNPAAHGRLASSTGGRSVPYNDEVTALRVGTTARSVTAVEDEPTPPGPRCVDGPTRYGARR